MVSLVRNGRRGSSVLLYYVCMVITIYLVIVCMYA